MVVLESEILYNEKYPLSVEAQSKDYVLELGKAYIERPGTDVTICTFSRVFGECLKGAGEREREIPN